MGRKRSFGARARRRQTDSATTANKGQNQQGGMLPGRFCGGLPSSPSKEVRTGRRTPERVQPFTLSDDLPDYRRRRGGIKRKREEDEDEDVWPDAIQKLD